VVTELFKDKFNLRRYYAGQALTGLLANGKLLIPSVGADYKRSSVKIERLAVIAFDIADAMIETANETD